jgi:hypothetical protein
MPLESPETIALRRLLAGYLAGEEPLDRVVPEFTRLLGRHFETHFAALKQGIPSLSDFQPTLVTAEDRQRMQLFYDALLDSLPPSPIQYLSPDESSDGAA